MWVEIDHFDEDESQTSLDSTGIIEKKKKVKKECQSLPEKYDLSKNWKDFYSHLR